MDKDEIAKITEKGLPELDLEYPAADSIYTIGIPRIIKDPKTAQSRPAHNTEEYMDFLFSYIFPLIDQLEKDTKVDYWHILNHGENLDLRLSIYSTDQRKSIEKIFTQHNIDPKSLITWGTYKDPDLGSRLGCQSLLRLYQAQSKFARDMVRSIYWIQENVPEEIKGTLISSILNSVPIYTSHMLLNIFPSDVYYEATSHLDESLGRFDHLLKIGMLPSEAKDYLDQIKNAYLGLRSLLQ